MASPVAALYIDPRGPYRAICWACGKYASCDCDAGALECWDNSRDEGPFGPGWRVITRDARLYEGPHPVVAHPPCGPWGRLRHLYKGNEHDCAPRAVEQVRRWGGVLEHPAGSKLWEHCKLTPVWKCVGCGWNQPWRSFVLQPADGFCPYCYRELEGPSVDSSGGYTIEVDQCEWGHVARKRTWLYLVGVPRSALEAPPFPGREPTHWVAGNNADRLRTGRNVKFCSAQQRRRTPPLFAEYLIRLARSVSRG